MAADITCRHDSTRVRLTFDLPSARGTRPQACVWSLGGQPKLLQEGPRRFLGAKSLCDSQEGFEPPVLEGSGHSLFGELGQNTLHELKQTGGTMRRRRYHWNVTTEANCTPYSRKVHPHTSSPCKSLAAARAQVYLRSYICLGHCWNDHLHQLQLGHKRWGNFLVSIRDSFI